jgi:hypothetical protein
LEDADGPENRVAHDSAVVAGWVRRA